MQNKNSAIVIGAGIGGLAAANLLAKAGLNVTVFEKGPEPGGRMGRLIQDGYTFDTGPSWYLMKDVFEKYFNLFGKKTADYYELIRLDPAYKVFYENLPALKLYGSFEKNLDLFENIEKGSSDQLNKYLELAEKNYQLALNYVLYNNFRSLNLGSLKTLSNLFKVMRLMTQSLHSYTRSRFAHQELQQVLEYPSVFLGGSPYNTPAIYQLMSHLDFNEGVFYPRQGGMYSVVESLYKLGQELGVEYKFNSTIQKIVTTKGIAKGVKTNDKLYSSNLLISNADIHHTETTLLESYDRSYPEPYWTGKSPAPSAMLMYLGVKGKLPQLEHHNLLFVKNWKDNFEDIFVRKKWPENASIYISKTTATDSATAPSGHENLFVLVPLPPGKIGDLDCTHYPENYLKQIAIMTGISDLMERITFKEFRFPGYFGSRFNAWQNTALGLSHTLTQSALLRPSVKSKKVTNLYYVGAGTQPGIGVPMCIISAQLVYKRIVGDNSPSAPTTIKRIKL